MTYDIRIDTEVCIGSGLCLAARPDVFDINDDGVAEVVAGSPAIPGDAQIAIARGCPSGAIRLHDIASGDEIDFF
ncbi:ferredoxin [Nocardia cerradoensis]|uniref:Ferredoxin-1 n=1 Tax=Nocardia cerradoensis TaxID=85688 RepID=A0A231GU25_9NOCA|nr:ferredoxin [Nocardia cerradoensis]NKY41864.1 ferredoxin [Nocardia cerradoensis]OXR39991.1 Ferredoxin-1 [Nocardia cerradoensis]